MRRLLLSVVVLCVLVFVVVPYLVLPAVLENLVARDVQNRLGLSEPPGVELDSNPQWEMLGGEFSSGRITVEDADLGGVRAESAAIDLDPFTLDWGETLKSREIYSPEAVSGRARLEVSEEEVLRLAQENSGMPVNGVELSDSGATINSEASAFGTMFPVTVEGGVDVEGGDLVFRPRTVEAAGVAVPGYLAESLLAGTAFQYPVEDLPYGGTITGARTTEGAVVLSGRVPAVQLGPGG